MSKFWAWLKKLFVSKPVTPTPPVVSLDAIDAAAVVWDDKDASA